MISARVQELVSRLKRPLSEMPAPLALCPAEKPFHVVVRPPGSKSLTNRALLLAALANGETILRNCLLDADDALVMIAALRKLGAEIDIRRVSENENEVRVRGVGGKFRGGCELNLNNAGTATRFLAAVVCLADAPVVIDGNTRMRKRPIGELLEMLRELGVRIDELGEPGCVPIRVHPCRPLGGTLRVGVTQSSQFISALMMLAPWTIAGVEFQFLAPPTSVSYILMTASLLWDVGVKLSGWQEWDVFGDAKHMRVPIPPPLRVPLCNYSGFEQQIESVASSAGYFLGAAAVVPDSACHVRGVSVYQGQADSRLVFLLAQMGADSGPTHYAMHASGPKVAKLRGRTHEMETMPDAAMTAAAVACFATGSTELRGLRTLRVKETDRLAAVQAELTKLGVKVEIEAYTNQHGVRDELLRITPPAGGIDCSPAAPPVVFDTYDDHRMAMSLAIIGLRRPNVSIRDPACVAKTYPTFWRDWARLYEGE